MSYGSVGLADGDVQPRRPRVESLINLPSGVQMWTSANFFYEVPVTGHR